LVVSSHRGHRGTRSEQSREYERSSDYGKLQLPIAKPHWYPPFRAPALLNDYIYLPV